MFDVRRLSSGRTSRVPPGSSCHVRPALWARLSLLIALMSLGCASTSEQAGNIGNAVVLTADGLERIKHSNRGTLYIKRDHGISTQHQYMLNKVFVTYEPDSPRFTANEEARMRDYVEAGVLASVLQTGAEVVPNAGPCVLSIGVGMIDVEIHKPNTTGASTSQLAAWGAVTMVIDVRDSRSREPLLRYGRRIGIPGGVQTNDAHPQWVRVRQTLDALLASQHKTFRDIVPESSQLEPSCQPSNEALQQARTVRPS